jgi:hypothetical protein
MSFHFLRSRHKNSRTSYGSWSTNVWAHDGWCSPHALLYHGYIPQVGGISKMWGPNSACPHLALILRLSPPSTALPYTKLLAEIDVCVRTTLKVDYHWGTTESPSPCWKWVSIYEKKAKVNLVSYNICWHGFHIN